MSATTAKHVWRTTDRAGSHGWHGRLRLGRVEIGWHVYRHTGRSPDRWVFQPFAIYDRKRPPDTEPGE